MLLLQQVQINPYIEKYKIYVTDSSNNIDYSFYVTGGSTSVECPVTVTIVGEVDNIGGGKFVILPDIDYNNVKISAYNVRLATEGNISNPRSVTYVTSGRTRNCHINRWFSWVYLIQLPMLITNTKVVIKQV